MTVSEWLDKYGKRPVRVRINSPHSAFRGKIGTVIGHDEADNHSLPIAVDNDHQAYPWYMLPKFFPGTEGKLGWRIEIDYLEVIEEAFTPASIPNVESSRMAQLDLTDSPRIPIADTEPSRLATIEIDAPESRMRMIEVD